MDHRTVFLDSLARCQEAEDFLDRFYGRFMASSDDVADRFRFTDFDSQKRMLRRSLELSAGATEGVPAALAELRERSTTHDRDHLNIKPELYKLWLDAIVGTASECDKLWDDDVEESWKQILEHVVKHMTSKY